MSQGAATKPFRPNQTTEYRHALETGATLVTATNRLARLLLSDCERAYQENGKSVWRTPDILPWAAWLQRGFQALLDNHGTDALLLSNVQELAVWQRDIAFANEGLQLLRPRPAAKAVSAAYALIKAWEVPTESPARHADTETRLFTDWVARFERRCASQAWIPGAKLPALLGDAFRDKTLEAPQSLLLAGFDDYSPTQRSLLEILQAKGSDIAEVVPQRNTSQVRRFGADDRIDEIRAAARWALSRLRRDPNARIGIVVPEIHAMRALLARVFSEILHPECRANPEKLPDPQFAFSLGVPLDEYPVIADALRALKVMQGEAKTTEFGALLRSPFFGGGASEWAGRCRLDSELRDRGSVTMDWLAFARSIDQASRRSALELETLRAATGGVHTLLRKLPRRALPSQWTNIFDALLRALGWPGERALDSDEFQTVARFRELYTALVQLDRVSGPLSYHEALATLQQLNAETIFQPQGRDAPIKVMGALEAGGIQFDHLWVQGLSDDVWPPPAAPHPLLPYALQRSLGMPHASAQRELTFAQQVTDRLCASAEEVVLSYPIRDGDRELRPSPLVLFADVCDVAALELTATADFATSSVSMESVDDHQAPQVTGIVHGGTQLLAAQASCPFSAVATYRLGARPLSEPQEFADGRLTGSLFHMAIEGLWRSLASFDHLLGLGKDQTVALVEQAATDALDAMTGQYPQIYGPRYTRLEKRRLTAVLSAWLDLERMRAPFKIASLETRTTAQLRGLQLQVRADRIDELTDGSQVVIDYKTAKRISLEDWTQGRITQPQVPLYCVNSAAPIAAALIGQLRTDGVRFHGIAREDGLVPDVSGIQDDESATTWPQLLGHWRTELTALATEIEAGHALPTPSDQACAYCPLPGLCRRYEFAVDSDDD